MWCQKRSALLPATVISPRLPPPRCTSRLLIMMRPSPLWLLQYWSGTDAEERREDRAKTSPDIQNGARRLQSDSFSFSFFCFVLENKLEDWLFCVASSGCNSSPEFNSKSIFLSYAIQPIKTSHCRFEVWDKLFETHNTSYTQWQNSLPSENRRYFLSSLYFQSQSKRLFPLCPNTGSGTSLCCDAAGLIFRDASSTEPNQQNYFSVSDILYVWVDSRSLSFLFLFVFNY